MLVIPVIDLQGGVVVRATGGNRAAYRPIETPLASSPEPAGVVRGFLTLAPFKLVYVADLDAIEGRGLQLGAVDELLQSFPDTSFWLDAGVRSRAELAQLPAHARLRPVLGSETLADAALLENPEAILSLDFRGSSFLGQADLLENADRWPNDIIVMTLHSVGAGEGPDIPRVRDIAACAGKGRRVYAAGGVRGESDLSALFDAGATGALVSTALHNGSLSRDGLRKLMAL